jgi:hypothetical protein
VEPINDEMLGLEVTAEELILVGDRFARNSVELADMKLSDVLFTTLFDCCILVI